MQQEFYVVESTVDQDSGKVLDATCTCKANALKRCARIAGMLILFIGNVEAHGYDGKYHRFSYDLSGEEGGHVFR